MAGVKSPGDTPGEAVELYPDKAHPFRSQGDEGANAATRLQERSIMGHAKALSASSMARPKLLPPCVFIAADDRIRKERQGHHAKSREAGERPTFVGGGRAHGLFGGQRRADHTKDVAGLRFVVTEVILTC